MSPRRRRRGGGRAATSEGGEERGTRNAAPTRGTRPQSGGTASPATRRETRDEGADGPSRLSNAVAVVSALLVAALVALLAFRAIGPRPPAQLSVTVAVAEARSGEDGWVVPLDVRNDGGAAAKEIVVEASAPLADGTIAVPPATIDYLAGGEKQRLYAVFPQAPAGAVSARVGNYQEP